MEPITKIAATMAPLPRDNIDTDQIIPSDWLKSISKTGYEKGLFSEWREDPSFVLNDERYKGAKVLLVGANFGIGSSREHAVWALMQYGFVAVVAPKFGDIFRNNATKNGLLTIEVYQQDLDKLIQATENDPTAEITIDVATKTTACEPAGVSTTFPLDDFTQYRFLNGLDDIGITLQHLDEIDRFEQERPAHKPVTTT